MEKILWFFSTYKDVLITVGWLIAAVGWLVSNHQGNQREKRKETRSEVDAICKAAAELITKCRTYYASDPSDNEDDIRVAEIAFEVKRILIRTERLNRRVGKFKKAVYACGDFFDQVTQEPFASKGRPKLHVGSKIIQDIEASVHNLIDNLEEGFTEAFS